MQFRLAVALDRTVDSDARRRVQDELDEMRARCTRESRELGDLIGAGEREFEQLMLGVRNLPRSYVIAARR